jgi:hypothetical protein
VSQPTQHLGDVAGFVVGGEYDERSHEFGRRYKDTTTG